MKVLIIFNHPAPYKVKIFNELAKLVDLDVIFERTSASDRPADFYAENDIQFNVQFIKGCYFSNENTFTSKVKTYIKKHHHEYDLIIMNGYSTIAEMKAINYMNKKKIPFVLYINGGVVKKESKLKTIIKKKFISSAKYYISPSLEANDYLIHYGANKDAIYNYSYSTFYAKDVLDRPLSNEDKNELRKQYNLPLDETIFVSASQFIERKNIKQLLRVFKDRKETLLLIGSGPQLNDYLKYIEDNNMNNVIVRDFMKRDELLVLMSCCNYFITLSKQDIYGHTTNEAMAKGLPVISSDKVVSSLHLIKNYENGFIVELNDDNIHKAIDNINQSMCENALKTARKNTIEETAKNHIEIFEKITK